MDIETLVCGFLLIGMGIFIINKVFKLMGHTNNGSQNNTNNEYSRNKLTHHLRQ